MKYSEICEVYEQLYKTSGRLDKITILSDFLKRLKKNGNSEWIYLLRGRVLPDYDARVLGLSGKLAVKAISRASGVKSEDVVKKYNKVGDLGDVAEELIQKKKQSTLFSARLTIEKVFNNFRKILDIEGRGAVDKKLALVVELLNSASGVEAKYIIRTVIGTLRVGVADSSLRDAIAEAFFEKDKKEMAEKIEDVYDLANDFALVFDAAIKGRKELDKVEIVPGKPMHVMLPVKVTDIKEAFRICGKPAACFPKGELVFSNPSIKRIEDINENSLVLGKNGQFQQVIETFNRKYSGRVIKISPSYLFPFSVTPNHKVLTIKSKSCSWKNREINCRPNCQEQKYGCKRFYKDYNVKWVEAGLLEKGDFLLFPKFREFKKIDKIDILDFNKDKTIESKNGFIKTKSFYKGFKGSNWIKRNIELSNEFFELMGWYLAEGNFEKRGIKFSLGYKEVKEAERIKYLIKNVLGIDAIIGKIRNGVISIKAHSIFLPNFFEKSFGRHSINKRIPEFVMYSDVERIKCFIKSYIGGDGHINKNNVIEINTASLNIVHQMILLLSKLGILPTVKKYPNRGLGGTIYRVVLFGKQVDRLIEDFHKTKTNHQRFFEDNNFFYIPVDKIDSFYYRGDVYNFETKDNTYLTSALVHNCEHKYDGFRVVISKYNNQVKLFTRRLDDVTNQFPDVVEVINKYVKGASFIIDSEVVGYNPKTKKYKPFEAISQRIRRKYHIDKLIKELPVEVNVFDVIYHDGNSLIDMQFKDRRKLLEKIIKTIPYKIRTSKQFVTGDEKKAITFYHEALDSGEEGIMIKKLDAPYKPGRRVGYIVKMKPQANDLDLVITAAEHGTGKRAGWLTSFIVACKDGNKYVDVGKVSSGLKEKDGEEGTSYKEMTKMLKPLIINEKGNRVKVKPKIVVAVTYQNIQKSPTYDSGYALRFPRIVVLREDKPLSELNTLKDIEKESKKQHWSFAPGLS